MQLNQDRDKLTKSKTERQAFFNQAPDLLCIIQPDGSVGQLNLAWKSLLGWTPEDLKSHRWIELVHPEDVEATQGVLLQVSNNQCSYVENRYRCRDGNYRSLSWSLCKSEEGYWYAIARDLATQQQVTTALKPPANAIPFKPQVNNWSIEKKTTVLLGVASVILIALNVLFYRSFIKQKQTSDQVNQSQLQLQTLTNVLSSIKDAETGQRGYLLTGQESYLAPYNLAVKTLNPQIAELKKATIIESNQQQQLQSLEFLVGQKMAELKHTIDLRKNQKTNAALQVVLTNQGLTLMDQIRQVTQQMQDAQSQKLQNWLQAKDEEAKTGLLTFLVGIVLNLLALYLVYRAIRQETTNRQLAEASYKQLHDELEARVQSATAELQEANANLLYSNRELEQFAYVASHDLQEPLRAVNSYAQLLTRKYQGNLDAKADKYLNYITEGATRMQQLISDLLSFSRVGTRAKPLELTNCESVLNQVLDNLKVAIAEDHATITHDPLPTVMGDETQLIQLFQNLIANAIKFRREEPPQVHISATQQQNEWVFGVHDNGIGIESEYFERIFMIFQRLHSRNEYPGNGIGLANCKKIVERHAGRIWVESTPGVGTTFHFTIPRTRR